MELLNTLFYINAAILSSGILLILIISFIFIKSHLKFFLLMATVPFIASIAYLLMANNIGFVDINGEIVNITRYVDWFLTTPILLYIFSYVVSKNKSQKIKTFLILGGLDILMLSTGLGAELTNGNIKTILFSISTVAYLIMLYFIVDRLLKLNNSELSKKLRYVALSMAWIILILWSIYPFIWIFGSQGLSVVGIIGETISYMILDFLTKIGFSILLLRFLYIKLKTDNSNVKYNEE